VNISRHSRKFKPRAGPTAIPPARLRHLARRVHSLGPRPLYELLLEVQGGAPLNERLEAYAAIAPFAPLITALGDAELPALRPIGEGRAKPARMKPRARRRR
jgi:hypothetical protein